MNDEKVKVYFSPQEIVALNQLLDLALKAGGRKVVMAFASIDSILQEAVNRKVQQEKRAEEE